MILALVVVLVFVVVRLECRGWARRTDKVTVGGELMGDEDKATVGDEPKEEETRR